jgi:hypothetical protein
MHSSLHIQSVDVEGSGSLASCGRLRTSWRSLGQLLCTVIVTGTCASNCVLRTDLRHKYSYSVVTLSHSVLPLWTVKVETKSPALSRLDTPAVRGCSGTGLG